MADRAHSAEPLFLTTQAAAKYLGCSREELLAWVKPDRRLPGDYGPQTGARLWRPTTLDAVKPNVEGWRARDRAASAARMAAFGAQQEAAKARRKGMRKGGAVTAKAVCARLECSLTELNHWASDGRLPADGEIVMAGLPKTVNARAWLPGTIEAAKQSIDDWRAQDQTRKTFKRHGLRQVL